MSYNTTVERSLLHLVTVPSSLKRHCNHRYHEQFKYESQKEDNFTCKYCDEKNDDSLNRGGKYVICKQ